MQKQHFLRIKLLENTILDERTLTFLASKTEEKYPK